MAVGNRQAAVALTDAKLKGMKPPASGQIEWSDAKVPGLRVRIGASGAQTFILRKRVGGKVRNITVGRYGPRFGIADARKKARSLLSDIEAGGDPTATLATPRRAGKGAQTIRNMLPDYLVAKSGLRSVGEVKRIMERYVLPEIGDRMADAVTRADVTRLIDDIAATAPVMARATHAQLSAFYTWAMPRLDRLPANPCRDAGRPPKPEARDRVLSESELRALWQVAEEEALPWGAGLKLLILTGQRREEVFAADRDEFDLKAGVWTIPADRAKNGVAHRVPLAGEAVAVLESIPAIAMTAEDGSEATSPKLFPARSRPMNAPSGFSKAQARFRVSLAKKLNKEPEAVPDWTLHDIRRTVATGLQRLGIRVEVTEAVLNHVSGSRAGIVGVYQRHSFDAEKRHALEAWAADLARIVCGDDRGNVVVLHG
ncbi:tyrosine-type recombinase/integrase [Stakelama marina]|uniref:Tyrosine-type recombinase/integrase n=1 Tax=Stakelama marina TaxID=2826939 RepID=A0A8T4I9Q8_9SPHN|nr:site-specific integrase [Stakelama marina]MBR0551748.1 tyrosine-type recombinase/integrase [Stakelama marina]